MLTQGDLLKVLPNINVNGSIGCLCGCQNGGASIPTFNMPNFSCGSYGGGPLFRINFGGNPVLYGSPTALSAGAGFPDYMNGTFMPFNKTMCLPQMVPNFGFPQISPMLQMQAMQQAAQQQAAQAQTNELINGLAELVVMNFLSGMANGQTGGQTAVQNSQKPIVLCIDNNGNLAEVNSNTGKRLDINSGDDFIEPESSNPPTGRRTLFGEKSPAAIARASAKAKFVDKLNKDDRPVDVRPRPGKKGVNIKGTQPSVPPKNNDTSKPVAKPASAGGEPVEQRVLTDERKREIESIFDKIETRYFGFSRDTASEITVVSELDELKDWEIVEFFNNMDSSKMDEIVSKIAAGANPDGVMSYLLQRLEKLAPENVKVYGTHEFWADSIKVFRCDPKYMSSEYKKIQYKTPIMDGLEDNMTIYDTDFKDAVATLVKEIVKAQKK